MPNRFKNQSLSLMDNFDDDVPASTSGIHFICCQCYMFCGLRAEVKGKRVVKLHGDPDDPTYQGGICVKGTRAVDDAYSPRRQVHPLRKVGPRDSGKWERITWSEALTTIADNLERIIQKHGPRSFAMLSGYQGNPQCLMAALFTRSLGSPDVAATTPLWCEGPGMVADPVTAGGVITHFAYHDIDNAQCVVQWGTNLTASHPPYWKKVLKAKARGARLIVVDPLKTPGAARADLWLPIRPGTDTAMALAWMNVIINERLYDQGFVDRWCHGFEELRSHVQAYSPDRVAQITGVSSDLIVRAARMYAMTRPACLFARNGITQKPNATDGCRAVAMLISIAGSLDVPGGNLLPKEMPGFVHRSELTYGKAWRLPEEIEAQAIGAKEFPLWTGPNGYGATSNTTLVIREMLSSQSQFKAALLIGSNVVLNSPSPNDTAQALKNMEFIFTADLYLTPTTELADIFLPASMAWEREEFGLEVHSQYIIASEKAADAPGEAWSDNKIFIELAKIMRQRGLLPYNFVPWDSPEEFFDFRLKEMGMTFQDLKKVVRIPIPIKYKAYEEEGFKTPTGKVELYSTILEKCGYDPLPHYRELPEGPVSTPEMLKEFPLTLITPRDGHFYNSYGRHSAILRKLSGGPLVQLHPLTAKEYGIDQGDWVWIESPSGKCKMKVTVTEKIPLNTICGVGYWWFPEKQAPDYGRRENNISEVISGSPYFDPVEGTSWLGSGHLCRVRKVSGKEGLQEEEALGTASSRRA